MRASLTILLSSLVSPCAFAIQQTAKPQSSTASGLSAESSFTRTSGAALVNATVKYCYFDANKVGYYQYALELDVADKQPGRVQVKVFKVIKDTYFFGEQIAELRDLASNFSQDSDSIVNATGDDKTQVQHGEQIGDWEFGSWDVDKRTVDFRMTALMRDPVNEFGRPNFIYADCSPWWPHYP